MAPRKKSSRVIAHESSKVSSTEYTPVKASTSRKDAQTPAMCVTRERTEYEAVDESPSPGIFSPVNKPTCDIEWAWKSPVGRMGSAANATKRRLMNKTPVQKTKRSAKANSPLNHFPSKRKLIKSEQQDSDHLSILTSQLEALKQCVPDEQNPDTSKGAFTNRTPPNKSKVSEDSLTALLDDDNYFTLLQCSQYVEEKLVDNPEKTTFSPIYIKPPVEADSTLNNPSVTKSNTSLQAPINRHSKTSENLQAANEKNQRVVIEAVEDKERSCSEKVVVATVYAASTNIITNPKIGQTKPAQCEKPVDTYKFDNFADDSFDDVLANFCDENIELLSQGKSSSQEETPNNVLELSISGEEKRTNLPLSPELKVSSIDADITSIAVETTPTAVAVCASSSYSFDDDFLQPDLLKILDAIESSDLRKVPSQPPQCTPEEIEKKRLEAKMKLEMKKKATIVQTNRLPSRASFGNMRR